MITSDRRSFPIWASASGRCRHYDDGNNTRAVTWFKRSTTASMLARLEPLEQILTKHGVVHDRTEMHDPGEMCTRTISKWAPSRG